mmetsp:Transcript_63865/g.170841  ORF Transcript_63865/g.170841 Transcript_63865/m.170841 type:complete len:351 (+) Transcript_63865:328-1380(+)
MHKGAARTAIEQAAQPRAVVHSPLSARERRDRRQGGARRTEPAPSTSSGVRASHRTRDPEHGRQPLPAGAEAPQPLRDGGQLAAEPVRGRAQQHLEAPRCGLGPVRHGAQRVPGHQGLQAGHGHAAQQPPRLLRVGDAVEERGGVGHLRGPQERVAPGVQRGELRHVVDAVGAPRPAADGATAGAPRLVQVPRHTVVWPIAPHGAHRVHADQPPSRALLRQLEPVPLEVEEVLLPRAPFSRDWQLVVEEGPQHGAVAEGQQRLPDCLLARGAPEGRAALRQLQHLARAAVRARQQEVQRAGPVAGAPLGHAPRGKKRGGEATSCSGAPAPPTSALGNTSAVAQHLEPKTA